MSSFGEFSGAVLVSILLRWFYTKHLMLMSFLVCIAGGLLYGIGKYGWMLLIGQTLLVTDTPLSGFPIVN